MSLSEKQRERADSEVFSSESVESDQSKGEITHFTEESPTESKRSDSPVFSSVSMKSDHSKGDGPNFSENSSSAKSKRSDSPVFSSVSMKSDHSKGDGPNFSENSSSAESKRSDSPVFSSVSMKSDHSKGDGPNFSENSSSAESKRSDSPVFSSVSMKSDHSKGDGPNFSENKSSAESKRSDSPVFSSVSMKSDHSKGDGPNFSENSSSAESKRSDSPVFSSVSMKSDHSKGDGPNFSENKSSAKSKRSDSPVSSSVSVKSDHSKGDGPNFSENSSSAKSSVSVKSDHSKGDGPNFSEKTPSSTKRSSSRVSFSEETLSQTKSARSGSHVSVKSDHSKGDGPNFSEEKTPDKSNKGRNTTVNIGAEYKRWEALKKQKKLKSDVELASFLLNRVQHEKSESDFKNTRFRKDFRKNLHWIFQALENKIIIFLKNELEKFKKILKRENTEYFVQDFTEEMRDIKEAALDMTLYFLRDMKEVEAADALQDELVLFHQRPLKSNLKNRHQSVSEGIAKHGDSKFLNNIYTDLYITLGARKDVHKQNETAQIEAASRWQESQEKPIECKNLFESPEQDKEIRTVLTKGVAGIGKSISVQKFIVDWADGKENQDITFIFPLPFREMNLKEKEILSLTRLINQFFPEIKGLNLARNDKFKILFILDGLDECRLPLKFDGNETWRDVSSPASLDVLLTNLIKGNLLPSALIWITTRPAAASKIPPECIDRETEVQGFNDAQKKEEYFRKRFTDVDLANEIIDNVKQSKSLFIMCYIPVFCWISATVLGNILGEKRNNDNDEASKTLQESHTEDTPKSLTQMYTHFLRFQIQQSRRKCNKDNQYITDVSKDKEAILSLGKLAFHQLERNNLLFYDTDLEDCGINTSEASVYSGMCTQIFKEDKGIILGTTFCFVHLSIQEFIAALYAHLFLDTEKKSVFIKESTEQKNTNEAMIDLLKTAVDKALESETGHLDLFLRFLLGLSLQTNRPLLRGLLTQLDDNDQSKKEIVQYIKQKLEDNLSPERSINLFYCLNELNDQTLVKEIQTHLREGSLSSEELSPAQWSAVAFVLLTSEEEMEEFELQKFKKSDECLFRLLEVVKTSKRALLNDCDLSDKSCSSLAKALESDNNLEELNMSNNNLQSSGVIDLCSGLKSKKCKLKVLRLSQCAITEESCSALASVLSLDSSSLKDLDLSNNNLQDSGVKLLSGGLKENCKLEKLKFSDCSITEEGYTALASALRSNPSHLIELDLTENDPGESGVKHLLDAQPKQDCQLKIRFLNPEAEEVCQNLSDELGENLLLMRNLNLNKCKLGDSGLKKLVPVLEDKHCKLNTLMLNDNSMTEEDCRALAAALNSNPSNLKELNLSRSFLGDSGMKIISSLFANVECRVVNLMFNHISISGEGCAALASAFNSNPSNLRELDLSGNEIGDSGVTHVSSLLGNPQCALQNLRLSDCRINEEGYTALASALRSNPSHLIELDLTGNDPGQSGVKQLDDLLQDPNYQLKTLRFLGPAADEACQYVRRIVRTNPLLLRELNLSECELGDTEVKKIAALLQDKHCKINTLKLNNNSITEVGCAALTSAFNLNHSNLRELDLSGNKLENSGMMKICPLLKNPQCRLEKFKLSDCSITEEGYIALASALRSNPSHLIELDLTGNDPGQSGVKQLLNVAQKHNCKLTLRFLKSPAAEEACEYLTEVLSTSPLLLTELDLSGNKLGDLDGEKLSALLMDSHSKVEKIKLNKCELTEKNYSVLATVLSKTILKEMDLNNSRLLDSGVKEICEGLKNPVCKLKILKISNCYLTEESCSTLSSVLSSDSSSLEDLDLSNNNLQDSRARLLSDGLKEDCKLKKLSLSNCRITEEGYKALASALRSNPSHLIELDLTGNDPGKSGVKQLDDLLQDPKCQLKTLRFLGPAADEACKYVRGIVGTNPLLQRELNLSKCKLGDIRVNQIAALLQDKHCKLEIIQLNNNSITEVGCAALTSAFNSNPSNLIELDLSGNKLGNSGIKNICCFMENSQCRLEKLKLSDCSITEKGYEILTSSLKSNSHLKELELKGNDPGRSGVKMFTDMVRSGWSMLKNISYLNNAAAEDACKYLTEVLKTDPLQLTELDLSRIELGDQRWEKLSSFLVDSYCQVDKIKLNNYEMTKKSCSVLSTVLSKNTILKEMDLNNSCLQDSGFKEICEGLKKSTLKILKLSNCRITEEGYKALASALRSNPSHLIELDLTGNDPGQSGVKQLDDLLRNPKCQLKLRFLGPAADEACQYVRRIVGKNPLFLKELILSDPELGDSNVKNLVPLLQDKHCKLNKLMLRNCGLTEKSCSALATVLRSNSSLKELDMSNNNLQDSGVKILEDTLKNTNCTLQELRLRNCDLTKESCSTLATVLRSNSSLKELDMSNNNNLQDSGVKKLQIALENKNCTLQKLRLSHCSITEEGYKALASALRSNSSHLIELDLRGNDPGESGVKELNDLLQDPYNSLKALRFLGPAADEACQYVRGIVRTNPLLLKELNLSKRRLGDTQVNQIAALLQDKHCKLNTLNLSGCSITEEQCRILTSALKSNPSHLTELDLSENKIRNTGVKHLSDVLKDSHCKLERLRLRGCEMTDEGCSAVTSALKLNPSHLRELDLSGNKLGDSGVNNLSDLLMKKQWKIEKLDLSGCSITEKQCLSLSSSLCLNLSHLRELDLSGNKLENTGVYHLCDVLKDSHCKLERLSLKDCGITDVSALTQSLSKTQALQFLKELDLTNNKIDKSGKQLNDVIQGSNCKLSLDQESWLRARFNYIASKFRSETQEPVGTASSSSGGTQEDEAQPVQKSDGSKKHKSGSSGKDQGRFL